MMEALQNQILRGYGFSPEKEFTILNRCEIKSDLECWTRYVYIYIDTLLLIVIYKVD